MTLCPFAFCVLERQTCCGRQQTHPLPHLPSPLVISSSPDEAVTRTRPVFEPLPVSAPGAGCLSVELTRAGSVTVPPASMQARPGSPQLCFSLATLKPEWIGSCHLLLDGTGSAALSCSISTGLYLAGWLQCGLCWAPGLFGHWKPL